MLQTESIRTKLIQKVLHFEFSDERLLELEKTLVRLLGLQPVLSFSFPPTPHTHSFTAQASWASELHANSLPASYSLLHPVILISTEFKTCSWDQMNHHQVIIGGEASVFNFLHITHLPMSYVAKSLFLHLWNFLIWRRGLTKKYSFITRTCLIIYL